MLYFGYGMNTNTAGMATRCPDARLIGPALIRDWRLAFCHHADIEEAPGDDAWGVLWDITEKCLASLDRLEGYPHYYDRTWLPVEFNGDRDWALVYIMNRPLDDYKEPGQGYWDCLVEGYAENDLPEEQLHAARHRVDVKKYYDFNDLDYVARLQQY